MKTSLVCAVVAALAVGCGKDSGSDSASSVSLIEGIWKTGCISLGGGAFIVDTVTNTNGAASATTVYYNQETCVTPWFIDTSTSTFTIGDAVSGMTNTYSLDRVRGTFAREPLTSEAVATLNADSGFGYTDWALKSSKPIAGKSYDASSQAFPAEGSLFYTIVKVEGSTMRPGDTAASDGSTPEKRPTTVHSNIVYTKQ